MTRNCGLPCTFFPEKAGVNVLSEHAHVVIFDVSCQLETLSVYRLALLDLQLDRDADVQDAGEWTDGIWRLGIRAIGSLLPFFCLKIFALVPSI